MFKNAQDQGTLPNVEAASEQDLFWDRCRAMRKLSGEANKHRRWGAGCSCHEQELLQGKSVDCNGKGRRFREVAKYIDRAVQSLRAVAESLSLALFGGCEDLVLDLYNALVFMAALASAKLGFPQSCLISLSAQLHRREPLWYSGFSMRRQWRSTTESACIFAFPAANCDCIWSAAVLMGIAMWFCVLR
jgi:hypothetical protein